MFPATVIASSPAGRAPTPRVYTLPVVRPAPPRPAGGASVRTW
jgi:hypothetical protein